MHNNDGLLRDVKAEGSLSCSDMRWWNSGPREERRAQNKTTTQDLRREDYGLFKDLLENVQWDTALERKGAQERRLIFNNHLL